MGKTSKVRKTAQKTAKMVKKKLEPVRVAVANVNKRVKAPNTRAKAQKMLEIQGNLNESYSQNIDKANKVSTSEKVNAMPQKRRNGKVTRSTAATVEQSAAPTELVTPYERLLNQVRINQGSRHQAVREPIDSPAKQPKRKADEQ